MPIAVDTQNLHPSTLACLEALQTLENSEFHRILDIGCGNGVLGVVAAHVWPAAEVTAADIAPKAVDDTRKMAAEKGVEDRLLAVRSDGLSHTEIKARGPYDLALCNLLSEISLKIALDLKSSLSPGAHCILSGVLEWKAEGVEQAYTGLGFQVKSKKITSPWVTYILQWL
jgi:ribosomal protein L11 methyltransferase